MLVDRPRFGVHLLRLLRFWSGSHERISFVGSVGLAEHLQAEAEAPEHEGYEEDVFSRIRPRILPDATSTVCHSP